MSRLIEHLEGYLGPIDYGWGVTKDSGGIRVVRFLEQPYEGVTTYTTLGMSDRVLPMAGERKVRQELVCFADNRFSNEQIASFLLTFGEFVCGKNQALLRGDIVGPSQPIIPDVRCDGVYASMPVLYDGDFATYDRSMPPTVLVWLIPILAAEAAFVRREGWSRFEDLLKHENPDFGDLNREPIV